MHFYLPEEQKHTLRTEYITRLLIVWIFGLSVTALLCSVFLVPSYLASRSRYVQLSSDLVTIQTQKITTETKEIETQVKNLANFITQFSQEGSTWSLVQGLGLINTAKVKGIHISRFDFASPLDVTIYGVAETRDVLISFKKNIERYPGVSKVELPVSDLAKSKDITFVIRIQSK